MKLPSVAEIRKGAVAVAGLVGQAIALGVLHGVVLHDAQLILAAATAVGVIVVPNATVSPSPAVNAPAPTLAPAVPNVASSDPGQTAP